MYPCKLYPLLYPAGSLSQFLYFSFRSPHLWELLELPETMATVSEFTVSEPAGQTSPFLAAWRAARKQRLLEAWLVSWLVEIAGLTGCLVDRVDQ